MVPCKYELCLNVTYPLHCARTSLSGALTLSHDAQQGLCATFVTNRAGEYSVKTVYGLAWEKFLVDNDWVILPLIARAGACVAVEIEDRVRPGCLVPSNPQVPGLFSGEEISYFVLVDDSGFLPLLSPMEAINCATAIGDEMILDCSDLEIQELRRTNTWVFCRLDVPNTRKPLPGRLYVAVRLHNSLWEQFGPDGFLTLVSICVFELKKISSLIPVIHRSWSLPSSNSSRIQASTLIPFLLCYNKRSSKSIVTLWKKLLPFLQKHTTIFK
jgi:hypothetical protein